MTKQSTHRTGALLEACCCTENGFIPARVIASSFALLAFAAAVVVGGYVGNDMTTVLWRGIGVMLVCYLVGRILGGLAQHAIDEHTARHESEHPVPETIDDLPARNPDSSKAAVG
ncbi:MAG: hypothetical protein AAGE65_02525 [Planctomycetota bacterium]